MSESTINLAGRARPARPQAVLTVLHREWLSPHTVRITAGGPGFEALRMNEFTDKYAKLVFADPVLGLRPPYDLAALRDSLAPDQRPVTRTYTLRRADAQRQQLAIDFVVHGDKGIAAPWAAQAEPGDALTLSGASGAYRPVPGSDWHLFAGASRPCPRSVPPLRRCPAMPAASPTSRRATPASTWTRRRPVALTLSGCTGRSRGASPACWPTPCWPAPGSPAASTCSRTGSASR